MIRANAGMGRHRPGGGGRGVRVAEQVHHELAELIRSELDDPRVGMVTLTGVELTRDYAYATVHFTVLPDDSRSQQAAGTLSGGQQQMVSLARALLNDNRLILVDEPTKGLAPKLVLDVARVLKAAAETSPMLLVEQNLTVVRELAQDVVVLSGGRVVHRGPAAEFLDDERLVERHLGVAGADDHHSPDESSHEGGAR